MRQNPSESEKLESFDRFREEMSKDVDEGDDQDLNGNGTKGEKGVRTKHNYAFSFGSLKSNYLERDYTVSKQSGADRLYVQGAAGSIAKIKILEPLTFFPALIKSLINLLETNLLI